MILALLVVLAGATGMLMVNKVAGSGNAVVEEQVPLKDVAVAAVVAAQQALSTCRQYLHAKTGLAETMARGDFTQTLEVQSKDEIGVLANALNYMAAAEEMTSTVEEIEQITRVINNVNDIVSTIATAVEEQSATTKEIAGNVAQASQGIAEVNENVAESSAAAEEIAREIASVNQAAGEMSDSSSQVNTSARELSKLAEQLKEMAKRFGESHTG